jgi:hypothetical protein
VGHQGHPQQRFWARLPLRDHPWANKRARVVGLTSKIRALEPIQHKQAVHSDVRSEGATGTEGEADVAIGSGLIGKTALRCG